MTERSYLVTGASTGIGRACVAELAAAGSRVWAAVRSEADEKALRAEHPEAVTVLRMDLTDAESVRAAGDKVCAAGPLNGLVNNAGLALPAPLELVPLDVFRHQLEVNLTGQLAVTQAVLPALRRAREQGGQARIVMIGSIGDRMAGPMLGPYHASKFGLAGLTDSLRAELAPSGIGVVLVEPGAIATPIWQRGAAAGDELTARLPASAVARYDRQISAAREFAARAAKRGLPPQQAAREIVRALTVRSPRPRYLVGTDARIGALVARLPDRIRYRLAAARA